MFATTLNALLSGLLRSIIHKMLFSVTCKFMLNSIVTTNNIDPIIWPVLNYVICKFEWSRDVRILKFLVRVHPWILILDLHPQQYAISDLQSIHVRSVYHHVNWQFISGSTVSIDLPTCSCVICLNKSHKNTS